MNFIVVIVLGSLFGLWLSACSTNEKSASTQELCEKGVPRACAQQYRQLAQAGENAGAEKTLGSLCSMPRVVCYKLKPNEPLGSESAVYEKLVEQDLWRSGQVVSRQVVLYRTVDVRPDLLKQEKKKSAD